MNAKKTKRNKNNCKTSTQSCAVVDTSLRKENFIYAGWYIHYQGFASGVAKGGPRGPGPPIIQTKHKHTFKLHEIGQFGQFKMIKIVDNRSHF